MLRKYFVFSILSLAAVMYSGCATYTTSNKPLQPGQEDHTYGVYVDSMVAPGADVKAKKYFLLSAMQNVDDNDLQFRELTRYIANALSQKGYIRTNSKEDADQLISLAYWMGEPQRVTSTQTYNTSPGYSYPVGWMWYTVPPQIHQESTTETLYKKTLVLEAYDLKNKDKSSQLWKTTMIATNAIGDFRFFLPYMLTAGIPYFGVDSGVQKEVKVYGLDPMILEIRK